MGYDAPDCSIQLQCASVGIQLMKFVPTSTLVRLRIRGASAVTVTVTVTVTGFH